MRLFGRSVLWSILTWLTVQSTLFAGLPHFQCQCPTGRLKPFCLGLASSPGKCCCGSRGCGSSQERGCCCRSASGSSRASTCCSSVKAGRLQHERDLAPTGHLSPAGCHKNMAQQAIFSKGEQSSPRPIQGPAGDLVVGPTGAAISRLSPFCNVVALHCIPPP